jgi:filamentous hemagglutinin
LTVDAGAEIIFANGGGADLTLSGSGSLAVNGNLIARTGVTYSGLNTANANFASGSTYEHQHTSVATANSVPQATWNTNSLFLITGLAANSTAAVQWRQDFGNVRINAPNQASFTVNFAGFLGSNAGAGAGRIKGFLEILNTTIAGTGNITLNSTGTSTGTSAINVDGHLTVSGASRLLLATTGSVDLNVGGDLSFSSSLATASQSSTTGVGTLNVTGNLSMTSGIWSFASGNNGTGNWNVRGDLLVTGGTVQETGGGTAAGNITAIGNTSNFDLAPARIGAGTMNFIFNKNAGQQSTLLSDLTVSGTLTLTGGNVALSELSLKPLVQLMRRYHLHLLPVVLAPQ